MLIMLLPLMIMMLSLDSFADKYVNKLVLEDGILTIKNLPAASAPSVRPGYSKYYSKDDNTAYFMDASGTEYNLLTGGSADLDALTDVTITSPALINQILRHDGTFWVNVTPTQFTDTSVPFATGTVLTDDGATFSYNNGTDTLSVPTLDITTISGDKTITGTNHFTGLVEIDGKLVASGGMAYTSSSTALPVFDVSNQALDASFTAVSMVGAFNELAYNIGLPKYATGTLIKEIPTATYRTSQDYFDQTGNAGWVSGGAITDNLDGTVDVAAGTGFIRSTNDDTVPLLSFDWAGSAGVALVDGANNYVYLNYNGGAPIIAVTIVKSAVLDNENSFFELAEIYREGTTLHITDQKHRAQSVGKYIQQLLHSIAHLRRADSLGGLILGETGTRNPTMSAGVIWAKLTRSDVPAVDTSGADTFDRFYRDGGGDWTRQTAQTQWNNTQYDDGTGVLATINNNRYSVQYFYVESDGHFSSLFGQEQYVSLAGAGDDTPPSSLPPQLEEHALLIGRIIFQESAAVAEEIESAFEQTFGSTGVTDHNNLANLTVGDDHDQYALLSGRTASQTLYGSADIAGEITIAGTSSATTGFTHLEPNGGKVTIGTASGDDGNYLDIEENAAGNLRVRVRNLSAFGNSQFELRNDIDSNMAIGILGSGVAVGALSAGSVAIISQSFTEMNIMNDTNDPINFLTDITDSAGLAATVKAQIAGDGSATFNFGNDDADFTINASGSGIAYQYDASGTTHRFNGPVSINGPPATSSVFRVASTTESSSPCPTQTTVERDLILAPEIGSCIYNSDDTQWQQYTGSVWAAVAGGGGSAIPNYFVLAVFDAEEDLATNWTATTSTISITSTGTISGAAEYFWTTTASTATLSSPVVDVPPASRGDAIILTFPHKTTEEINIDIWDNTNNQTLGTFTSDNSSANTLRAVVTSTASTAEISLRLSVTASTTPDVYFNRVVLATAGATGIENDIIDSIGEVGFFARDADFNGWISALDTEIGDAGSGATYAHGDYRTLYENIWSLSGTQTATSTGLAGRGFTLVSASGTKGGSANADWNAGNVIVMDLTGEFLRGSSTATATGAHQDWAVGPHGHDVNVSSQNGTITNPSGTYLAQHQDGAFANSSSLINLLGAQSIGDPTGTYTADETRPSNTSLNPFIRYKNDTVAQTVVSGTGGGGGGEDSPDIYGIVYTDTHPIATTWTSSISNASFSETTVNPLFGDASYVFTNAAGATGEFISSPAIAVDPGHREKVNSNEWTYTYDGASGAIRFDFYNITDGQIIGSASVEPTSAPTRIAPEGYLVATGASVRADIVIVTAESASLKFDRGVFRDTAAGALAIYNASGWEQYIPVTAGIGTPSNVDFYHRRVGDSMEIMGSFTAGTTVASELQIGLPIVGGAQSVVSSIISSIKLVGNGAISANSANSKTILVTAGDAYLNAGLDATSTSGLVPQNGNIINAGSSFSFHALVPIEGWRTETDAIVRSSTGVENDFTASIPSSGVVVTSEGANAITAIAWAGNTVTYSLVTDKFTVAPALQFTLDPVSYTVTATVATATFSAPVAHNITLSSQGVDYKNPNAYAVLDLVNTTLNLTDGVTEPSTEAYAQLFVDIADGDLKVKFSDGTVTTIATD